MAAKSFLTAPVYLGPLGLFCELNGTDPKAILRAGFDWRPYALRAYFDTNMIMAESKGRMSHPYLQFMMGHKGISRPGIQEQRRVAPGHYRGCAQGLAYGECEPFPTTSSKPLEEISVVKEAKIEALKSIARSLLGIDLLEVSCQEEELGRELSRDEELELFEGAQKALGRSSRASAMKGRLWWNGSSVPPREDVRGGEEAQESRHRSFGCCGRSLRF